MELIQRQPCMKEAKPTGHVVYWVDSPREMDPGSCHVISRGCGMFYGNHNGSANLFLTSIYKATIILHLLLPVLVQLHCSSNMVDPTEHDSLLLLFSIGNLSW